MNPKGFTDCSDEELKDYFNVIKKELAKASELPFELFEEPGLIKHNYFVFSRYNKMIKKNYHKILIGYRKILKKYKIKFRRCSRKNIRRK